MLQAFPILHTPQLLLRRLGADDIPLLVQHGNDPGIARYIRNIPHPYQEPDAVFRIGYVHQGFKTGSRYVFAIIAKETDLFCGEISLHLDDGRKAAQLAYWMGAPLRGKGYMTEAIGAVVKFGFGQLQLETVFATCEQENIASVRVLEKNNFTRRSAAGSVVEYIMKCSNTESL